MNQIDDALVRLLSEGLADLLPEAGRVGVCAPNEAKDKGLGIYLYHISPCGDVNLPPFVTKGRSVREQPPRFLTLFYLLTAYSRADAEYRAAEEHRILARAMQVMDAHQSLTERELGFAPGAAVGKLQAQLVDLSTEEMSSVWSFREVPYKLSVAYRILPVELTAAQGAMLPRVSQAQMRSGQK